MPNSNPGTYRSMLSLGGRKTALVSTKWEICQAVIGNGLDYNTFCSANLFRVVRKALLTRQVA